LKRELLCERKAKKRKHKIKACVEANESSEKEEAEHIEPSSSVEETVLNWEGDVEAIPNQKKSKKLKVTRLSDQTETINDAIIKCEKPLEQELSENPKKAKKRKRKVRGGIRANEPPEKETEHKEPSPIVNEEFSSSDEEIVRSTKKAKKLKVSDSESSDDEVVKKKIKLDESTDEDMPKPKGNKLKVNNAQGRIRRCLDSSDEEDCPEDATPKADRINKLKEMANKLKQKKSRKSLAFFDDEAENEHESDDSEQEDSLDVTEDSDEDLPMFEHEDELPDSEDEKRKKKLREQTTEEEESEADSDDNDFLDDDEEQDNEEAVIEDAEEEEEESDEDDRNEESEEDISHMNPYLDRAELKEDLMQSFSKSINSLSKNTAEDKQNKKKYKEEIGKYQLAIRSKKNKAAFTDTKVRYKRNMKLARFDKGLKDDRNLDVKDDEFHNTQEVGLYGERVQIFPHSKMRSKRNGNCELTGCGRAFIAVESKIVGAKIYDPFNLMYMKKRTRFDKEAYYWICRHHMQDDEETDSDDSD